MRASRSNRWKTAATCRVPIGARRHERLGHPCTARAGCCSLRRDSEHPSPEFLRLWAAMSGCYPRPGGRVDAASPPLAATCPTLAARACAHVESHGPTTCACCLRSARRGHACSLREGEAFTPCAGWRGVHATRSCELDSGCSPSGACDPCDLPVQLQFCCRGESLCRDVALVQNLSGGPRRWRVCASSRRRREIHGYEASAFV